MPKLVLYDPVSERKRVRNSWNEFTWQRYQLSAERITKLCNLVYRAVQVCDSDLSILAEAKDRTREAIQDCTALEHIRLGLHHDLPTLIYSQQCVWFRSHCSALRSPLPPSGVGVGPLA